MAQVGKAHLLITFVAPAAMVPEIDRLVTSHGAWMAETHERTGPKALLSFSFSKGPELSNPLDPGVSVQWQHSLRPERGIRVAGRHPGSLGGGAAFLA